MLNFLYKICYKRLKDVIRTYDKESDTKINGNAPPRIFTNHTQNIDKSLTYIKNGSTKCDHTENQMWHHPIGFILLEWWKESVKWDLYGYLRSRKRYEHSFCCCYLMNSTKPKKNCTNCKEQQHNTIESQF